MLITCDRANYFKDNAMLRLTGVDKAPVVQKDGRTISGEIITMWLNDNRVETSGDIKVQIPATSTKLDQSVFVKKIKEFWENLLL